MGTGTHSGQRADPTWRKDDDLFAYDCSKSAFVRIGHVPQCKAQLGDVDWCDQNSTSRCERFAAVVDGNVVLWGKHSSNVHWYALSSGTLRGSMPVPDDSELLDIEGEGDALLFAFCNLNRGIASIWDESGQLQAKQQVNDSFSLIDRICFSTAPAVLLALKSLAADDGRSLRWEIREWRYREGLYRTGNLVIPRRELDQPTKKFVEEDPYQSLPADQQR